MGREAAAAPLLLLAGLCCRSLAARVMTSPVEFEDPSPDAYTSALALEHFDPMHIELPLSGAPHMTPMQFAALKRWAAGKASVAYKRRDLFDVRLVAYDRVPRDLLAELPAAARKLVALATKHLQRRLDDVNKHKIEEGWRAHEVERFVSTLDVRHLAAFEDAAITTFGASLDTLCRAAAARGVVLGAQGAALLQRARRVFRLWLEGQQADGFQECPGDAAVDGAAWAFDAEAALAAVAELMRRGRGYLEEWQLWRVASMALASRSGVLLDIMNDCRGAAGEIKLMRRLEKAGVPRSAYFVEAELQKLQMRMFGRQVYSTPDVLFKRGVVVNGRYLVRWIDSKGSCFLPGFTFGAMVQKFRKQSAKAAGMFGPGLVVWQSAFVDAPTQALDNIFSDSWSSVDEVEDE